MGDILRRSHPLGIVFLWRCARSGMWRERWARRIVARWWLRRIPVARRRLPWTPDDVIMRAAAKLELKDGHTQF
jgi:hypothetical protein